MFTMEILALIAHPVSAFNALTMVAFLPVIGTLLVATIAADRTA